jgi:hypothetical protein
MSHGHAVAALVTILLAGCDDASLTKALSNLRGDVNELRHERYDLLDQIEALKDQPNPDADELAALRQELEELAHKLDSFGMAPEPKDEPNPVPEPSVSSSEPIVALNEHERYLTDPSYVCEPVFRLKSCTDWGEPVWLDSEMGWLPFGEVR